MHYQIRLSFDFGSGVCLWSKNEEADKRFGYPVNHWNLPLSENTKYWLTYLIAWYDTSLNWENPSDDVDIWSIDELLRFKSAVKRALGLLRSELPENQFEIILSERFTRDEP